MGESYFQRKCCEQSFPIIAKIVHELLQALNRAELEALCRNTHLLVNEPEGGGETNSVSAYGYRLNACPEGAVVA